MTLGLAERQRVLGDPVEEFCGDRLEGTVFGLLARERDRLFPDEMFADLFTDRGRRSVPPSVVACVMVLQRLEHLSDRDAVDRFTYDARWRHACGVGGWDDGLIEFVHTVLVRFRMRLEASDDPRRIFRRTTQIAAECGLVGPKRVLDSAPLFDAVATMDTVTLVRSAVRGLLRAADTELENELRGVLSGADDYTTAGKPACDWDDAEARAEVIDRLARDGWALLAVLEGRTLDAEVDQAAELLACVIGQDLERDDEDGTWRIVRGVASDRVISTVDPDARHGRKSTAGKFDGYKGHIAIDPDSEIITATAASAANVGDGQLTGQLTEDLDQPDRDRPQRPRGRSGRRRWSAEVFGDAAYGSGEQLAELDERNIVAMVKTQPPPNKAGRFTKDDFFIDLDAMTVTCPAAHTVPLRRAEVRPRPGPLRTAVR
ncbi:MAG: transposase [Xanthomonadales bacterium]|nr:transposase [Xanthomonadales bacterium]